MSAPKTPLGKGRSWIALHTRMLNDAELTLCSNSARVLFTWALLLSADQGLEGYIPSNPKLLHVTIQLDGGVEEMKTAIAELRDIGKLVDDPDGDEQYLYFRAWEKNQSDRGGSKTRPLTAAVAQPTRRHREGYHDGDPRENCPVYQHLLGKHTDDAFEGCELCADTDVEAPDAPPVTETAPPAAGKPSGDGERTMKAVLADFNEAIPVDLAQFSSPFEGYTALLTAADDLAELVSDLSTNARGALRNAVLAHALRNLVDEKMSQAGINRANKAAKALGDDGHRWWVHAAVLAAGHAFEDERHCLNWMTKTARGERSKAVAA